MRTVEKYSRFRINFPVKDYTDNNPISKNRKEISMKSRETTPAHDSRRQQLMEDLQKTKFALDCAYSNFENVVDPDLVDCSIYELKAVQMRYRFLLKQAELLDSAT
jgi:hypothetical protein